MPHAPVSCHTDAAAGRHRQAEDPTADGNSVPFILVTVAADQEVAATRSRRLRQPADFRAAARFMVGSELHPLANATTLRIADDFADRMPNSSQGHVAYALQRMMLRLGLSRRAVTKHVGILRQLGLLAFVTHGSSRRNALRARMGEAFGPGTGFARTATIYAPCAPSLWDTAMGRRLSGTGYEARIAGYTEEGRARAVAEAAERARPKRRERGRACTPSFVAFPSSAEAEVDRGSNYTARRSAPRHTPPPTSRDRQRRRPDRPGPSAAECARGIRIAEQVRREVWWLSGTCSRRLGYALRPLITAGWSAGQLGSELRMWGVPGRLRSPVAYLRHELRRRIGEGALLGPAGRAPLACEQRVDESGARYSAMKRAKAQLHRPAWQRFASSAGRALREQIAAAACAAREQEKSRASKRPAAWHPMLREPEREFTRPWSGLEEPNSLVRQRNCRDVEHHSNTLADGDGDRWEELADQAAAARAFAKLRRQLEQWSRDDALQARETDWLYAAPGGPEPK